MPPTVPHSSQFPILQAFLFGVIDSFNLNRFCRAVVSNPGTFYPFMKVVVLHVAVLVIFPLVTCLTDSIADPTASTYSYQIGIFLIRTFLLAVPLLVLSLLAGTVWCRDVYDSVAPPQKRPPDWLEDFVMVLVGATIPLFLPIPIQIVASVLGTPWLSVAVKFLFGVLSHALYAFNYRLSSLHLTADDLVPLLERRSMYLLGFGLVANSVCCYVQHLVPVTYFLEGIVISFAVSNILLPVHVVVSCDVDIQKVLPHVRLPVLRINYYAVERAFRFLHKKKREEKCH